MLLGFVLAAVMAAVLLRRRAPQVVATGEGLSVPTSRGRRDVAWNGLTKVRGRADRWGFQQTAEQRHCTTLDLPIGLTSELVEQWRNDPHRPRENRRGDAGNRGRSRCLATSSASHKPPFPDALSGTARYRPRWSDRPLSQLRLGDFAKLAPALVDIPQKLVVDHQTAGTPLRKQIETTATRLAGRRVYVRRPDWTPACDDPGVAEACSRARGSWSSPPP